MPAVTRISTLCALQIAVIGRHPLDRTHGLRQLGQFRQRPAPFSCLSLGFCVTVAQRSSRLPIVTVALAL